MMYRMGAKPAEATGTAYTFQQIREVMERTHQHVTIHRAQTRFRERGDWGPPRPIIIDDYGTTIAINI